MKITCVWLRWTSRRHLVWVKNMETPRCSVTLNFHAVITRTYSAATAQPCHSVRLIITKTMIYLSILALLDMIIPIPFTALVLIYVVLEKPAWFENLVTEIYSWNKLRKRDLAPISLWESWKICLSILVWGNFSLHLSVTRWLCKA